MLKFIFKRILKMSSGCIPALKNTVLAAYFPINTDFNTSVASDNPSLLKKVIILYCFA
jgi:hypothetical protein